MLAAEICFVAAWTAIKKMGQRLPLFEIIFFRAFFSLLILLPLTRWRLHTFRGRDLCTLFLRAITGYAAMILAFYAIINIEIGDAVALFNTLPIFVALMSPALLGEPFRKLQLAFIAVAFAGVIIVLKPSSDIFAGASLYALIAGFLAALAMICIRKLGATDSPLIITLYFTAFSAIASLPVAASDFILPTVAEWAWLAFVGLAVTFGQLFMTKAYKFGTAATISPFGYASVIGSYIAGLFFFSEIPDHQSIVGAFVIIASGIGIMLAAPPRQCVPGSTPGART